MEKRHPKNAAETYERDHYLGNKHGSIATDRPRNEATSLRGNNSDEGWNRDALDRDWFKNYEEPQ